MGIFAQNLGNILVKHGVHLFFFYLKKHKKASRSPRLSFPKRGTPETRNRTPDSSEYRELSNDMFMIEKHSRKCHDIFQSRAIIWILQNSKDVHLTLMKTHGLLQRVIFCYMRQNIKHNLRKYWTF